jgi:cyclopropane fatty-acyl-phospholipid synthase-like methyltransferase
MLCIFTIEKTSLKKMGTKQVLMSIKFILKFVYIFPGGFLSDAGWFAESEKVLLACQDLCQHAEPTVKYWCKLLECYHKYVTVKNAIY